MRHVIVFCYIFTILIGVSALTIQWLAGKGQREKNFSVMKPFIGMLLFMNLYDFIIYYSDNIMGGPKNNLLLSIGDCFIAVLVLLWLRVIHSFSEEPAQSRSVRFAEKYVIFYAFFWLAAIIFFPRIYWLRLIIDVPLITLLLVGSILNIQESIEKSAPGGLVAYKVVITFFMIVNYASYFISESGILQDRDTPIMDITIFYWLIINVANMVLLYKRDFQNSYKAEPVVMMDLKDALDNVRIKYELTKREIEILEQIYNGRTNTQIAEELFISESTVKAHIYNLFRKLEVKSRVEAVCIVREEKEGKGQERFKNKAAKS